MTRRGGSFCVLQIFQNFQQELPGALRGRDVQLFPAGVDVVHLRADGHAVQSRQLFSQQSAFQPRGLIIGSVVDAGYEETGVAKFALLDPAADINSLEQVFIITQYTTEVAITPVTATDSETATAPSETAATQATTPVG